MHKRVPTKGLSVMEKRVPRNEKYSHVHGVLDTGLTVDKVKFVTAREYSKRRDEIFFRLNKNQLHELYNEYEVTEYESITEAGRSDTLKIVTHSKNDEPSNEKPYLILDVREAGAFNAYHVLQARSFPYTLIRRDQLHPEIYKFRNKQEALIIVCCDDERISKDVAKTLVDRGTDNVYLLTGGIDEFAAEYPAFIEGIPPSPRASPAKLRVSSRNLDRIPENEESHHQLTPNKLLRHNGGCPPAASSRGNLTGRQTHRDDRSDSGVSTRSNMSVAESIISRASARKGKF